MSIEAITAILKHHEEVVEKLNNTISNRNTEIAQISAQLADARKLLAKRSITDATAGAPVGMLGVGARAKSEVPR